MAIVGIVEGRHQDQAIGDIKVGVACRQSLSPENYSTGKRQFDYLELPSLKIGGRAQTAQIVLEWLVVCVILFGVNDRQHCIGCDEARKVIDMAGRVFALDATSPPEHLFKSQKK